jgi:hypothetical protein
MEKLRFSLGMRLAPLLRRSDCRSDYGEAATHAVWFQMNSCVAATVAVTMEKLGGWHVHHLQSMWRSWGGWHALTALLEFALQFFSCRSAGSFSTWAFNSATLRSNHARSRFGRGFVLPVFFRMRTPPMRP